MGGIMNFRFEELRILHNYTKTQVSDYLGVSKKAYNNWENNKESIPTRRLIQLSNLYEINIDYLVGITNTKLKKKSSNNPNIIEIGKRVREIRVELNLTLRELADILSISNSTWSKYETGINLIQFSFLIKTCKMSGISVDYILGRTKVKYLKDLY